MIIFTATFIQINIRSGYPGSVLAHSGSKMSLASGFAFSLCFSASLRDSYLLFSQPVKLVDQGVDLAVRGLDALLQSGILVRRADFVKLFMKGEHLLLQGSHAIRAATSVGSEHFHIKVNKNSSSLWDYLKRHASFGEFS